jgi:solute carrier family 25, member 42
MGLYRGITPTLLGVFPYAGIAFALNEQAKRRITNLTGHEPTTFEKLQCGALSGLFAQTLTYPLEVTRRRMQTMGVASGKDAAVELLGLGHASRVTKPSEMTMINTIREVLQEQGMKGLLKGVSLNWVKGPIAFSISFTVFDQVQGLLETDSERTLRRPHR